MKTEPSEDPETITANYNMERNQELTTDNCSIEEIDENTICVKEELTCEPMIDQFLDDDPSNYEEMLPLPDPEKLIKKSAKLHTLAEKFYGQQLKQNKKELSKFKAKVKKAKKSLKLVDSAEAPTGDIQLTVESEYEMNSEIDELAKKLKKNAEELDAVRKSKGVIYQCRYCPKQFNNPIGHRNHLRFHEVPKPIYKCPICNKICQCKGSLGRHIETHSDERNYECEICHKKFKLEHYVQIHMTNMHKKDEEKRFKCEICQKSFNFKAIFEQHIRKHTGDKPFKCSYCEESFFDKRTWIYHERRHTGEKPFICEFCPSSFLKKPALKEHLRIHTGERPYECDVCHKTFRILIGLTKHKVIHTGERPFKCKLCPKTYTQTGDLYRHRIKSHPGSKKNDTPETYQFNNQILAASFMGHEIFDSNSTDN